MTIAQKITLGLSFLSLVLNLASCIRMAAIERRMRDANADLGFSEST